MISKRKQTLLLFMVAVATFVDGLDGSIVSIILPSISTDFCVDASTVSWISTVYFLLVAGFMFIFGKLSDIGHIKKVFVSGLVIFTVGSLFCGLSVNFTILIVSRSIQAIGASMLASSALMLCTIHLPMKILSFAVSVVVLGSASGFAAGPAIGGVLASMQSWHWTFIINVPIGIALTFIALYTIPRDKVSSEKFDVGGALLLLIFLTSGLYVLQTIPFNKIDASTAAIMIFSVLTFIWFIIHCKRKPEPIVDLSLFNCINLNAAIIVCLLMNACYMGLQYIVPFYSEKMFGFSPIISGLYLSIPAVITLPLCIFVGKISDKLNERRLFAFIGCVVMLIEMILMFTVKENSERWPFVSTLILMGIQFGIAGGPVGARIIYNTPEKLRNIGSAITSFVAYFGSAFGIAVFSGAFRFGAGSSARFQELTVPNFMNGLYSAIFIGIIISLISLLLASIRDKD
ncbi:MAG: MFS transporter [archaeon]|nr:MFS transporter [archaeon]